MSTYPITTKLEFQSQRFRGFGDSVAVIIPNIQPELGDVVLSSKYVKQCYDFADNMSNGYHREYRSGGTIKRTPEQIKEDAFKGKIGEYIVKIHIEDCIGIKLPEVDFNVYVRGVWDAGDFTVNNKIFSIKTIKSNSRLLLLEKKDYPSSILNVDVVLVAQIDLNLIGSSYLQYLENGVTGRVCGIIYKDDLLHLIERQLSENSYLEKYRRVGMSYNTDNKMDADNFFIHIGDLCQNLNTLTCLLE